MTPWLHVGPNQTTQDNFPTSGSIIISSKSPFPFRVIYLQVLGEMGMYILGGGGGWWLLFQPSTEYDAYEFES